MCYLYCIFSLKISTQSLQSQNENHKLGRFKSSVPKRRFINKANIVVHDNDTPSLLRKPHSHTVHYFVLWGANALLILFETLQNMTFAVATSSDSTIIMIFIF